MISLLTGTIGVLAAVTILFLIRRDHLHVRYGLGWMVVAIAIALLGLFPRAFDQFAAFLGVAYGPVLALTFGLIALVIKTLVMDIGLSRTETRVQRLVQRVALLEAQLHQTNQQKDPDENAGQREE